MTERKGTAMLRRLAVILPVPLLALTTAGVLFAQGAEELRLSVGKSVVLDYPGDIRQISTSDPTIVDAIAVTTREVLLHAKAQGFATVIIWPKSGPRTIYSIVVEQNLEQIRKLLKDTFPTDTIQVQGTKDSVALTGHVATKEAADRAAALVTPFGKTVVNNLNIAPPPIDRQIVLKVKFAEVNRAAVQQLGINILSTGAAGMVGVTGTGQFSSITPDEISGGGASRWEITDALNIFAFRPDLDLGVFIKALQQQDLLQILAEPNVVTTSGKEASFLVGGEFPVPVLQGGGNAGAVTVQFREFGIRLNFNPVVTPNNTIRMYVKPEVSSLDYNNAVTLSGFTIPALSTRRVETNVELSEGQSFVIGGLIDDRVVSQMRSVPGLASIPLLGYLFKSRELRKTNSELVVLVTPELAVPLNPGDPVKLPVMPKKFLGPVPPDEVEQQSEISHPADLEKGTNAAVHAKDKKG